MVLASGITDTVADDSTAPAGETTGFVPSDLSKAYYKKFPTTVAQLDKVWGSPIEVSQLADGTECRVYDVPNPYSDFRYRKYIVKDGVVVASRISSEQATKSDGQAKEFKRIEINEISHA